MNDDENVKTDMCDGQVILKGDNDGKNEIVQTITEYFNEIQNTNKEE